MTPPVLVELRSQLYRVVHGQGQRCSSRRGRSPLQVLALKGAPSGPVAVLIYLQPLVASVLARTLLGEELGRTKTRALLATRIRCGPLARRCSSVGESCSSPPCPVALRPASLTPWLPGPSAGSSSSAGPLPG